MKKLVKFTILIGCLVFASYTHAATDTQIQVKTDPRVELMSIIFRLSQAEEFSHGKITSYNKDVDRYFARFKNHQVVKLAKKLRETRGISYNAPIEIGLHVKDAYSLEEIVDLNSQKITLDKRWTAQDAKRFLSQARQFVIDSKFKTFIDSHSHLYEVASKRMQKVVDEQEIRSWFDDFFGKRPKAKFTIILSMLNGPASYGPRVKFSDNSEILYCILGISTQDKKGYPTYHPYDMLTVVHEFCHSYCNPFIDRHASDLQSAGKILFKKVEPAMRNMAYGQWKIMLYESMVRASVIQFAKDNMEKYVAQKEIHDNIHHQFFWIDQLSNLLNEYQQKKAQYRSLDNFFPKIKTFFNTYAKNADKNIETKKKYLKNWSQKLKTNSPKIVSSIPVNNNLNVPYTLNEIIITFDRPMKKKWALMSLNDATFPKICGQVSFDQTQTTLTIPVHLKPNHQYELGLNGEGYYLFASEAGDPLYPTSIRFKTAKA